METMYRNTALFFAIVLIFVFVAFFNTYFSLFPNFEGTTLAVHFHVAILLLWFVTLIVQPVLIGNKQVKLHRVVGKISYVLVPLVVITGMLMIRQEQMREKDLLVFTANIIDLSIFVLLFALAIIYKRKTSCHSRFMILSVLPFISAPAARLQINGLAIELSILLLLLIIEGVKGKIYKPYLLGLLVFFMLYIPLGGLLIWKVEVLDKVWEVFFN